MQTGPHAHTPPMHIPPRSRSQLSSTAIMSSHVINQIAPHAQKDALPGFTMRPGWLLSPCMVPAHQHQERLCQWKNAMICSGRKVNCLGVKNRPTQVWRRGLYMAAQHAVARQGNGPIATFLGPT
jgi:hypothetical protein